MKKKTIIITGASSGLGRAIALEYAGINTKLFLLGRSVEKLSAITAACKMRHAEVEMFSIDVQNKQAMFEVISKICNEHIVDILITSAGVSAGTMQGIETINQVEKIFSTNLDGTLNTVLPALPSMIKNGQGSIVLISSMAGLLGLSSAPSYSSSKAAVKIFGDALRGYLQRYGVKVCIAIPGYIDTPMTKVNNFPMPFKISAAKAAKNIIRAIENQRPIVAFPLIMYIFLKILSILPAYFLDYINSKIPGKPAFDDCRDS